MGTIVCDGRCSGCDFRYWEWIKRKGILVLGNKLRLRECSRVDDD